MRYGDGPTPSTRRPLGRNWLAGWLSVWAICCLASCGGDVETSAAGSASPPKGAGAQKCTKASECTLNLSCQTCPDGSCAPKTAVCNEGRCEEALGACPEVEPCRPQQATGQGECAMVLGVGWNGGDCQVLTGCTCDGPDCQGLFSERSACIQAHVQCYSEKSVCKGLSCGDDCLYCDPAIGCPATLWKCDGQGVCGGKAPCQ